MRSDAPRRMQIADVSVRRRSLIATSGAGSAGFLSSSQLTFGRLVLTSAREIEAWNVASSTGPLSFVSELRTMRARWMAIAGAPNRNAPSMNHGLPNANAATKEPSARAGNPTAKLTQRACSARSLEMEAASRRRTDASAEGRADTEGTGRLEELIR